jgi:hypothetical protein
VGTVGVHLRNDGKTRFRERGRAHAGGGMSRRGSRASLPAREGSTSAQSECGLS